MMFRLEKGRMSWKSGGIRVAGNEKGEGGGFSKEGAT
jgi:hypothetical protein